MKKSTILILVVLGAILLLGLNYAFFSGMILGLGPEVKAALESDAQVQVVENKYLAFLPQGQTATTGLLFFPEGRQDVQTYAVPARAIAEEGYAVILMSRRGADIDADEEQRLPTVMADFPEIENWVIGGHTWGGVVGSGYALNHLDQFSGIVLWATRMDELDLSGLDLPVLYVFGTNDDENVAGELTAGKAHLPPDVVWVPVEGGNRVGFASFGPMAADVGADITEAEQQVQAAQATVEFLQQIVGK
ncbi:MAG: hypothetical protein JXB38_00665 [Anaerolineales bacterium]|nr:hypothetical protein [Anaerolineales bacterium]